MAEYFGNGYYHAMDREYNTEQIMPIHKIGVSIMATKDVIQPLVAKIREGASKVEIGFMGRGKGSIFAGQITPESVSSEQRRAIREIAKVNKIEFKIHIYNSYQNIIYFLKKKRREYLRIINL